MQSIRDATPAAQILFLTTPEDEHTRSAIDAAGLDRMDVPWEPIGDYARKINASYRATSEPLIFTGALDLRFRAGWFEAATAALAPGIGVVGTNDLGGRDPALGEHATHSLITREYADEYGTADAPGAVLHEGYWHEYVDTELVETAQARGAWAYAAGSVVEHLHPDWGKAPSDDLYRMSPQRMEYGRAIYETRRHLWWT
jgi:hypothetical protein